MAAERAREPARMTAFFGIGGLGAAVAMIGLTDDGLQAGVMIMPRDEIDAAARSGRARGLDASEAARRCVCGAVGAALRSMLRRGKTGSPDG